MATCQELEMCDYINVRSNRRGTTYCVIVYGIEEYMPF